MSNPKTVKDKGTHQKNHRVAVGIPLSLSLLVTRFVHNKNIPLVSLVLAAISVLIVLSWSVVWWHYTIDDSFISYRYAKNFSNGIGLVFNPGERVEGFSCPFWIFTLTGIDFLGGDVIWFSKMIGLFSAVSLPLLTYAFVFTLSKNSIFAGIGAVWCAVIPEIHIYACSGMETVPFTAALALAVVLLSLRPANIGLSVGTLLSLVMVLLFRPEGLLLGPLLAIAGIATVPNRKFRIVIALFFPILAALIVARYLYFDSFLPNTYAAKPSSFLYVLQHGSLSDGISTLLYRLFIYKSGPISLLNKSGGFLMMFFLAYGLTSKSIIPRISAAVVVIITGVVYLLYCPPDWMAGNRFLLPYVIPVIALGVFGLSSFMGTPAAISRKTFNVAVYPFVFLWATVNITETAGHLNDYRSDNILNTALDASVYAEIGKWLHENAAPTEVLLAYEIGAIGYYSNLRIVDHEGLIDKTISGYLKKAGGYDNIRYTGSDAALTSIVNYCVEQRPEWFLVRSSATVPYELDAPLPENCADDLVQNLLLKEIGSKMVLKKVFLMNKSGTDRYFLLKCQH